MNIKKYILIYGLVLIEMFEGLTVDDIRSITEADFTVSDKIGAYRL